MTSVLTRFLGDYTGRVDRYASRVESELTHGALAKHMGRLAEVEVFLPHLVRSVMVGEISAELQALLEESPQRSETEVSAEALAETDEPETFFDEAAKFFDHLERNGAIDGETRVAAAQILLDWGEAPAAYLHLPAPAPASLRLRLPLRRACQPAPACTAPRRASACAAPASLRRASACLRRACQPEPCHAWRPPTEATTKAAPRPTTLL